MCLEWGTDYSRAPLAGACREAWSIAHPDGPEGQGRSGFYAQQRLICARLEQFRAVVPAGWVADTIVCTQVFEHVQHPSSAMTALVSALAPGGFLIWSAPFLEKYHRAPVDTWRFTNDSAVQLLEEEAGLCVRWLVRAGNAMLTSGYLLGMGSPDFSTAELAHMSDYVDGDRGVDNAGGGRRSSSVCLRWRRRHRVRMWRERCVRRLRARAWSNIKVQGRGSRHSNSTYPERSTRE